MPVEGPPIGAGKRRSRGAPVPVTGVPDGIVLYDGVCVLCSAWFRFVAARDPRARFRFTQVQGEYGRWLALRLGIDPDNPLTNAVLLDGLAYVRSDAGIQVLRRLPGWRWAGLALAVPRPVRDWLYDRIARNRYAMFGRTGTCLVPGPELANHILPATMPRPADTGDDRDAAAPCAGFRRNRRIRRAAGGRLAGHD